MSTGNTDAITYVIINTIIPCLTIYLINGICGNCCVRRSDPPAFRDHKEFFRIEIGRKLQVFIEFLPDLIIGHIGAYPHNRAGIYPDIF